MEKPDTTYPRLLVEKAEKYKNRVAMREKTRGIWNEISWQSYLDHVKFLALGLHDLGLERGNHVSILAENCPEWLFSDLATQSLQCVSVGIYPTNSEEQCRYIIEHSESKIIFAGDQEQADKILAIRDDLPELKAIVVYDMRGMRHYDDLIIKSYRSVEEKGRAIDKATPDLFDRFVAETRPEDVAFLVYTSGTTGLPKGCMIPHNNHLTNILGINNILKLTDRDSIVSYLPLCHILERGISMAIPLVFGITINFAESIETVQENIHEISPTFFAAVPRILEKMHSTVMLKVKETTRFKRFMFQSFHPVGKRIAEFRMARKRIPIQWLLMYGLAYVFILRSLREKLGLLNCRVMMSGGAPISPEILKFFHSLGVFTIEMWAQTESCGGGTGPHHEVKPGSVGQPYTLRQLKLAEDGEILLDADICFKGYYKNEAATKEVLKDGWLYTGDVGEFDEDGHLYIVDRKKDIIITSGGKNISPSEVENNLKCSPFIKEAIVFGDGKKYLTAMIQLDYDNIGKWAQGEKIAYTNYKSLARNPEVNEFIDREIRQLNENLARVEQVKKFLILDKELDQDDEELTATQKVKRKVIEKRFEKEIATMY